MAALFQRRQRLVEDALPHHRLMPVVLVTDENQIELRQALHPPYHRGVPLAEIDLSARQLPARPRLRDRIRPQIHAQVKADLRRSHRRRQHPRLVRPPAGKVQHRKPSRKTDTRKPEHLSQQPP